MSKNDSSPQSFKLKDHAPLIELEKFSPSYANRDRIRASILLERSRANTPFYTGPTWALVYYMDLPRMKLADAYHAIKKLRRTPGDLMARYLLIQGINGGLSLAEQYLPATNWMSTHQAPLRKLLTAPVSAKEHMSRSGGEKIEHIAFHPTMMVLAMSTTYARVHLFDLRTNTWLDYFLCAADDPADLAVTALGFNSTNQLAVGMDTGCVDIWTVDLSSRKLAPSGEPRRPLFIAAAGDAFGSSAMPKLRFFTSTPSPGTRAILAKVGRSQKSGRAAVQRVELIAGGFLPHHKLIGSVTAVAFSPSGTHLAIGTSAAGVWIYNLTMATSYRAHVGSFSAASAKCGYLSWGVPPGVKHIAVRREVGTVRYQAETGDTALVAGMDDGAVVYIPVRDNGASSITLGPAVEFYPSRLAPGAPHGVAVSHVLLVPSPPSPPGTDELWPLFPTLVVALADTPGIHTFRLVPESVLKASVPSAAVTASVHVAPAEGFRGRSWRVYAKVEKLVRDWCGAWDAVRAVHVGTLDTSSIVFLPRMAVGDCDTPRPGHVWDGYGGVVRSMAIDPTTRRLIVSFFNSGDERVEDSVVWFDACAVRATISVLGALEVLRPQRVIFGDGVDDVGEVRFAGGFEGGACAGMVTGGGKGVGIFPAWIADGGSGNRWE